jgi:hypothetical protein
MRTWHVGEIQSGQRYDEIKCKREDSTSADSSAGSTLNARSKSTRTFLSSFIRQRKSAYLDTQGNEYKCQAHQHCRM